MFGEHFEILSPSGRNPVSQLYSVCDPTSALTNPTIEPFTGGVGSPQPAEWITRYNMPIMQNNNNSSKICIVTRFIYLYSLSELFMF